MKIRNLVLALVVLSLVSALVISNSWAEPQPCEALWNFCQAIGGCHGEPILVVYGGGGYAVTCHNPQNEQCFEWTQPCI